MGSMQSSKAYLEVFGGCTCAAANRHRRGFRHLLILMISLQFYFMGAAQGRININVDHTDIESILKSIESQSGYHYWMEDGAAAQAHPITLQANGLSLSRALELVMAGQSLTYKIVDRVIVVKLAAHGTSGMQVSGMVRAAGQPLENASVMISQTQRGTVTNAAGQFSLRDVPKGAVIQVSCVGFQPQERAIHSDSAVVIELAPAERQLDVPVVVAYGISSQRTSTSHINSLSSVQISREPITNGLIALEGTLPGIFVQQVTGTTGGQININIGGRNSIASGNDPLYIIDGIPFPSTSLVQTGYIIVQGSPLAFLSPDDIDGITVLKDATSTAIYGSRGANGVVIITTKRAKSGTAAGFSVSTSAGVAMMSRRMPLLSTPQYLQMRHEAFANDGATPDPAVDFDLLSWDTTRQTDWQKVLIGHTASIWQERLAYHYSDPRWRLYFSTCYHRETTPFPGDFHTNQATGHGTISYNSTDKKFTATVNFTGGMLRYLLPANDPVAMALQLPPNAPAAYLPDGSYNWAPGYANPYAAMGNIYKSNSKTLIATQQLSYEISKGLRLKVNSGLTVGNMNEIDPSPAASINPLYGITTGTSLFGKSHELSWTIEPMMDYRLQFSSLKIQLLGGGTYQQATNKNTLVDGTGYIDPTRLDQTTAAAQLDTLALQSFDYRYISGYGRVRLEVKDRYILEATGRRDGSSRFGPGRQFANFGAVGASWVFTAEPWLKERMSTFNFAKIGITYGTTGNDEIGDNQYQSRWVPVIYPYGGQIGVVPQQLYNGNYGWEQTRKFNISLDGSLIKDHLQFSATYYSDKTSQQLLTTPLSAVTGFGSVVANTTSTVVNRSWEFTSNVIIVKNRNFAWTNNLNITFPHNALVAFPGLQESGYENSLTIGKSLSLYKSIHYKNVDPATGDYIFEDADKDGRISYPNDLQSYKSIYPKFIGGLGNTIFYKDFALDILFQFVKQTGYNYLSFSSNSPGMMSNQPKWILSRWQHPSQLSSVEKFTQDDASTAMAAFSTFTSSDGIISDASFIRCKQLSVNYRKMISKKQPSESREIKIYLEIANLFTITGFKGLDPETQSANDYLPPLRRLVTGIELIF